MAAIVKLRAAVATLPTDEPSDHERGQQERDDHAHADEHIGENDSASTVRTPATNAASRACRDRSRQGPKPANGFEEAEAVDSTDRPYR